MTPVMLLYTANSHLPVKIVPQTGKNRVGSNANTRALFLGVLLSGWLSLSRALHSEPYQKLTFSVLKTLTIHIVSEFLIYWYVMQWNVS